ncbi:MAG TPA: HigA family addiction module antitoxin [Bauldia sp.]|nr:HigA family addiction module antitoxin [Bauldia sp.]
MTYLTGIRPVHPGEILREDVLPAIGRSKAEIARLLGISRQTLYDILDEKQPVTPSMALRIGKLFGNGPELWINMQRAYDLRMAEKEIGREIEEIKTLSVPT